MDIATALDEPVVQVVAVLVVAFGAYAYMQYQTRAIRAQAANFPGMQHPSGAALPGEMKRD